MQTETKPHDAGAVVATKATRRAAQLLGLSQGELAQILGVSPTTVSRMFSGEWIIPRGPGKELEMAVLFIRIFRSLDALMGGDPVHAKAWIRAENSHLQGIPLTLCFTAVGMSHVAGYLDAMRGAY